PRGGSPAGRCARRMGRNVPAGGDTVAEGRAPGSEPPHGEDSMTATAETSELDRALRVFGGTVTQARKIVAEGKRRGTLPDEVDTILDETVGDRLLIELLEAMDLTTIPAGLDPTGLAYLLIDLSVRLST